MTSVRTLVALSLLALFAAAPAQAGSLAKQCRKKCKPDIAECVELTGQPKRLCKRSILRVCKGLGLDACGGGSSGNPSTTTTTTLPPSPGRVDIEIEGIDRDTTTDPGVYTFQVRFISEADSVPLALDPSYFVVIDQSLTRRGANPASDDPDDCSASLVLAPGAEVVCTVRFVLPIVVGVEPEIGGEGWARLQFEGGGYIDANDFQLSDGGYGVIM
jgi:hypothetical protein